MKTKDKFRPYFCIGCGKYSYTAYADSHHDCNKFRKELIQKLKEAVR